MQGLGVLGEFELIHMHTNEAEEDRERQMDKEQKRETEPRGAELAVMEIGLVYSWLGRGDSKVHVFTPALNHSPLTSPLMDQQP